MDAIVVRFSTDLFDVSKETPNDINPIHGQSLLVWLAEKLRGQVPVPIPQTEDWGWYVDVAWSGRTYMVGVSASDEEENGLREWVVQVVKHRSMKEKLTGKEKLAPEDPWIQLLLRTLRAEPAFRDVAVE